MHSGSDNPVRLTADVVIIRLATAVPIGVGLAFLGIFCLPVELDWPIVLLIGLLLCTPIVWSLWMVVDARQAVRRLRDSRCPVCGFDRRAGLGQRCPECGWEP